MDTYPPRPKLSAEEKALDCLLQQTIANAKGALALIEPQDFYRQAESQILEAIRKHVTSRTDDAGCVDPELVVSHLAESGHIANPEVRRVINNVTSARTAPTLLSQHVRTLHVLRFRRAAHSYAEPILTRSKDGNLEDLCELIDRYSHLKRLMDRCAPRTQRTVRAA